MNIKKSAFAVLGAVAILFASCGKSKVGTDEIVSVQTDFSSEDAEKFLADFEFDYTEQSEKEIRASKNEAIKKLADYKIKYNINRNDVASAMAALSAIMNPPSTSESNNKGKDFSVVSWGPQNEIPGSMVNPEFFVTFSLPVKELSPLEQTIEKCDVFTVTPEVKGKYRWLGTRQLSFIPEEPLLATQKYTIKVNPDLVSLNGIKISGFTVFQTSTQEVKVRYLNPGSTPDKNYYYDYNSGVPVEKAGDVIATFNMPITEEDCKNIVSVKVGSNDRSFSATPVENYYDEKEHKFKYKKVDRSEKVYLKINGSFEKDTLINVKAGGIESYSTLKPFKFNSMYFEKYNSSITLYFNQPVNKKIVASNILIDGGKIPVQEKNITVSGKEVYIRDIQFEYDTEHNIEVKPGIKDIYGQTLSESGYGKFTVPKASSYIKTLDTGNKILEAQFPHKFIIEHQNLNNGYYAISSEEDPLTKAYYYNEELHSSNVIQLKTALDNLKHLDVIELDPYLKNGLGFVRISSMANLHRWDYWDEKYEDYQTSTSVVSIQVTDLGVTARAGYDKAIVLVRKLSDDSPVKNADVYLYSNDSNTIDDINLSACYVKGKTDARGYAEISIPENKVRDVLNAQYDGRLAVFVQSGDDKVTYKIDNHETWRFGIYSNNFRSEYNKSRDLIFMFTDRGIYKPGETVSFKGIGKNLTRDGYKSMTGTYTVKLEKQSWDEDEVYGTLTKTLSKAGGFSGSFVIPKDVKPGSYVIGLYNGTKKIATEYLTVAYFEKVKFQASATMPDVTYYLGDSISAELSASYLAGGSLTGATYNASWYKQATDFTPPVPAANNYVFGPESLYHSSNYISQSKGSVNESGATRILCNTEKGIVGQPYIYSTEIEVTDISNQRIYTGASKIVHPGLFYIGVAKNFGNGFAKTKEKIDIPFVLLKPDGKYAGKELINDKIEYSFSRSYWTKLNEDAVDGIYSRWERVSEVVETGKIDGASKGTISFTPQKSGSYKLTVTTKDKKGNTIKTDKSFFVTGSDYWWFDSDDSKSLRLTPDRNSYKPGETAKILLESPLTSGDYIVTVERDTILSSQVIHLDSSCTQLEIPVKAEYLPVVYVSVCSYSKRQGQPTHEYGEPDLGKPAGYYGVTEIFVDKEVASFKVDVTCEKETYRPGEEITLNIAATKDGKPVPNAELTLMVVDRAVIDLINYHVSDPLSFFYHERNFPLAVCGGDSRNLIMDPVTYKIKSLQGGDSTDNASEEKEERKDFRPTALFEPEIITDKNGKAKVKFKLPDSLTTYRVTAFGVSENIFALQESEVKVQNPMNVQAVQPRRLRVRDTAEAGVIVTNLDSKDQKVTVSISVREPQTNYDKDTEKGLLTVAGKAFIDGNNSLTVTVPAGKTMPVYFNVGATDAGNVELVYDVKSSLLKERLISVIEIEKPYIYDTVATTGVVAGSSNTQSESASQTEKIIIPSWCEDGMGEIEITLDPTQLGLMSSAVKYVFDYPYGCLEQQSSRIWPMIIFGDYIDVFGLNSKVQDPRKVVKSWFNSIKKEQHTTGGFGYWPGSSYDSFFVSLRFLHMYKLAINNKYTPKEIGYDEDSLIRYIKYELSKMDYLYHSTAAYACYVLSMFEDPHAKIYLDKLYDYCKKQKESVELSTLAYTALAYENLSEKDNDAKKKAKELASLIRSGIKESGRSVSFDTFKNGRGYIYGMPYNESETIATILQLFVMQKPDDEIVNKLLYTLLHKQREGYWQSTATTARIFEAISVLIKERNLEGLDIVSTAVLDGTTLAEGKFKGLGAKPVTKNFAFTGSELKDVKRNTPIDIEFIKNGKGSLYYTALMRYAIPGELIASRDEGFEVTLSITDEDGNEVVPEGANSKVIILDSGKTYKFTAKITTTLDRNYAAFRVPVPSGTEIVDSSLSTGASKNSSGDRAQSRGYDYDDYDYNWSYSPYSHEYFYDNEAQYFMDYIDAGMFSQTVTVRASRKGVYPTPPVQVECMYEPEVFGRSEGYLFIVK